jgi:hypothetical protein
LFSDRSSNGHYDVEPGGGGGGKKMSTPVLPRFPTGSRRHFVRLL